MKLIALTTAAILAGTAANADATALLNCYLEANYASIGMTVEGVNFMAAIDPEVQAQKVIVEANMTDLAQTSIDGIEQYGVTLVNAAIEMGAADNPKFVEAVTKCNIEYDAAN